METKKTAKSKLNEALNDTFEALCDVCGSPRQLIPPGGFTKRDIEILTLYNKVLLEVAVIGLIEARGQKVDDERFAVLLNDINQVLCYMESRRPVMTSKNAKEDKEAETEINKIETYKRKEI